MSAIKRMLIGVVLFATCFSGVTFAAPSIFVYPFLLDSSGRSYQHTDSMWYATYDASDGYVHYTDYGSIDASTGYTIAEVYALLYGSSSCSSSGYDTYIAEVAALNQAFNAMLVINTYMNGALFGCCVDPEEVRRMISYLAYMRALGYTPYKDPQTVQGWTMAASARVRYTHDNLKSLGNVNVDAKRFAWEEEASVTLRKDRWRIELGAIYSQEHYSGAIGLLDNESLGLTLSPIYRLLDQRSDGLDVDLITTFGYRNYMFDEDMPFDDADEVTAGAGIAAGKTTRWGDFRAAYVYQPTWNIDGDLLLTGENQADVHSLGVSHTTAITENLLASLSGIYQYTPDMPDGFDCYTGTGQARLMYIKNCWGLSATVGKSFLNDNFEEWFAEIEAHFTW